MYSYNVFLIQWVKNRIFAYAISDFQTVLRVIRANMPEKTFKVISVKLEKDFLSSYY